MNNQIKSAIKLDEVSSSDIRFLYKLLKEREPKVNISHRRMPTFKEHSKFVLSKPYSKWYIIKSKNKKIGSIYLSKQDEIGIFLQKKFMKKGIATISLTHIMKKNPRNRFLANISPKNKNSINFFRKHGFNLIQYTYEYIPNDN